MTGESIPSQDSVQKPELSQRALGENPTVISLSIVAAILLIFLPVISYSSIWHDFYFYRDDYGQIYHSLRQYYFHPLEWITVGFRDYFINYPEFTGQVTNLIRPLVNVTLALEGMFFTGDNHGVFLATNHILFVVNGVLALVAIRLLTRLPLVWCVLGLSIFVLSPAWTETFYAPSFRTGQIMMLFSLLSFIAIATATVENWRWRIGLAIILQCLSLFGHEIGIVGAPAAAVVWYLIAHRHGIRAPLYSYALFLIPIAFLFLMRFAVMEGDAFGIYIFGEYGTTEPGAEEAVAGSAFLVAFFGKILSGLKVAFFPIFLLLEPVQIVTGDNPLDLAFFAVLLALNAAVVLLFLYMLVRKDARSRAFIALAVAFVISLAPVALIAAQPRFAVIPLLFAACLWAFAGAYVYRRVPERGSRRGRRVAAALLAVPTVVLAAHFGVLAWRNTTYFAENHDRMAANYAALREAAADPAIDELILVNDRYGRFSSLAMLRMVAMDVGRPDLMVRVVNSLDGPLDPTLTETYASGQCADGLFQLQARLGAGQTLLFPNASAERLATADSGPVQYAMSVRWGYTTPTRLLNRFGLESPPDLMVVTGRDWSFRYEIAERNPAIVVISPLNGEATIITDCAAGFTLTP